MKRNLEIKARCGDLAAAARTAVELPAELHGVEWQRDVYFACPVGRLKLRIRRPTDGGLAAGQFLPPGGLVGEVCELIGYRRGDAARPRASDYRIVPVPDGPAMEAVLRDGLGVAGEVVKRRTVYLYRNVRIHLDEVEGLGAFIEFEAVLASPADEAAAPALVAELMAAFEIGPDDLLAGSYADLR